MDFVFAQIFGLIALFLSCDAVFKKNKAVFLFYEALVDLFYAMSYFCLQVYNAGIISLISLIAMLAIYYCQNKKFKYTFAIIPITFILFALTTVLFWQSWLDILFVLGTALFTVGFYTKNLQITRLCIAIPNFIMIIYNIIYMAYSNAILDSIETIVVVCAIIKFYKEKHLKKSALKSLKRYYIK